MLILSRKIEEVIKIGDTISIKVLGVQDGQVRLGIEAPKEIKIFRAEVYEQIQQQNKEAAQTSKEVLSSTIKFLKQQSKTKQPSR
ncbi:MAG: carbon storage regulator CsrA [Bacteroidetes bacterium]|nr:carbon storage regulator CsrA [Bacteroidota bacterium]